MSPSGATVGENMRHAEGVASTKGKNFFDAFDQRWDFLRVRHRDVVLPRLMRPPPARSGPSQASVI